MLVGVVGTSYLKSKHSGDNRNKHRRGRGRREAASRNNSDFEGWEEILHTDAHSQNRVGVDAGCAGYPAAAG